MTNCTTTRIGLRLGDRLSPERSAPKHKIPAYFISVIIARLEGYRGALSLVVNLAANASIRTEPQSGSPFMPATQEITETLIRENMNRAVSHVFKTMLSRMPPVGIAHEQNTDSLVPVTIGTRQTFQPHVIGTVGFIGEANGLIYLYIPLPLARLCARNLLSMTERELDEAGDETVNDAIGELTNIMIGSFKSGLCDAGYSCMLTMPSILRGDNFCSESGDSVPRHVYSFECAGHRLVTDILLKIGE